MNTPKRVNEPLATDARQPASASASAEIEGSWAAIRRAALRARKVALQTDTDLIVMRAGQVVRVAPKSKTQE